MSKSGRRTSLDRISRTNSVSDLIRTYSSSSELDKDKEQVAKKDNKVSFIKRIKTVGQGLARATVEVTVTGVRKPEETRGHNTSKSSQIEDVTVLEDMEKEDKTRKRGRSPSAESSNQAKDPRKMKMEEWQTYIEGRLDDLKHSVLGQFVIQQEQFSSIMQIEQDVLKLRGDCVERQADLLTKFAELSLAIEEQKEGMQNMKKEVVKMAAALKALDKEGGTDIVNMVQQMEAMKEDIENLKTTIATMEQLLTTQAADSRYTRGMYVVGIDKIKEYFDLQPKSHPSSAIKCLLYSAKCLGHYETIIPLDKGKPVPEAKSAMILFTSLQTKRDSEQYIKKFLLEQDIKGVVLRDIFPADKIQQSKDLNKKGAEMRQKGIIVRYRVINRNDSPVLQVLLMNNWKYEDYEEHMEEDWPATSPIGRRIEQKKKTGLETGAGQQDKDQLGSVIGNSKPQDRKINP